MRKFIHLLILCILFLLVSTACTDGSTASGTAESATDTENSESQTSEEKTRIERTQEATYALETTFYVQYKACETTFEKSTAEEATPDETTVDGISEETTVEETSEEITTEKESETVAYSLSDALPDPETGAYEYCPTSVHSGTDIYYIGSGENADKIIVIDPGHQLKGMTDTEPNAPSSSEQKMKVTYGTTGQFTGICEYKLTLSVALCLRDMLYSQGYSVVMVRETDDVEVSNIERAQIANKYNTLANIRIHANGADNPEINGAMTVCQTQNNPDNGYMYAECRCLSEKVLESYCKATGMKQLSVWETDTMTGTNWSEVPTTIIEMGYMSNKHDDEYMATDEFLLAAAKGIADGIREYIEALSPLGITFTPCDRTATATGNVYIRTEPSIEQGELTKVGLLKTGEQIKVTGISDAWYRVSFNNQICYISNKYSVLE